MTGDGSGHAAWKPPAPSTTRPTTESLTGYSDLHQIGVGGDSVVYRATEDSLGRDVAIKVLNVDGEARAARFAREVEITLDLGRQHPNIVTVLATGITGSGRPAIVMEFYPGGTLHDRLREFGPLPVEEVVRIGLVLADALSFAHDRGVLHRDVKPQNVLVLPTSWVLADFGIARLVDSEHTSSVETFTYRHASPQVLDGHAPTAADDIWSLGSTLYTLVDGRPPFASDDPDDDSALAYVRRARIEPHRPLAVPGAEALAAAIDRCLVKDVDGRWSSAGELHDALLGLRHRAWEPGAAPAAAPVEPAPPAEPVAPVDHTGHAWAPSAPVAHGADPTNPRQREADPSEPAAEDWDRPPPPVALSAAAHVPAASPRRSRARRAGARREVRSGGAPAR
jgi:serine/threonine protein kinase